MSLKKKWFRKIVAKIIAFYLWCVYKSSRWLYINHHILQHYWESQKPFILVFWHGRLSMIPFMWDPKTKMNMLVSKHSDALLIADVINHFGINSIYGSTSKGGAEAARAMILKIRRGECIGITPDGPRGPKHTVSKGVFKLAEWGKVDIIPVSFSIKSHKLLKSWDQFMVPYPLSKGAFICGNPIDLSLFDNDDDKNNAIYDELMRIQNEVDAIIISNNPN